MKDIVLCADDYGQAKGISTGIIELAKKNRLSATSCLVNFSAFAQHAKWLLPYKPAIDIGLHLNFTEGKPLSTDFKKKYGNVFFNLPKLWLLAYCRRLDFKTFRTECIAQLEQFEKHLHFFPQFIDGHHHTHQFPTIRDSLLDALVKINAPAVKIRSTSTRLNWREYRINKKKLIIKLSGSHALKRRLKEVGLKTNTSFEGIYPFQSHYPYRFWFLNFINNISANGLIMCHPAKSSEASDKIHKQRIAEYDYFSSLEFLRDCAKFNVRLVHFL